MNSYRSLVVVAALLGALAIAGCTAKTEEPAPVSTPVEEAAPAPQETEVPDSPGVTEDVTELKIEDIEEGTGAEAKKGDTVSVHYTGWLTDGSPFDSSLASGQPFEFTLGEGMVISGWDEGVAGMKVGGTRKLIIPPSMGYGDQGAGGVIPGGATLVFQVELLGIK